MFVTATVETRPQVVQYPQTQAEALDALTKIFEVTSHCIDGGSGQAISNDQILSILQQYPTLVKKEYGTIMKGIPLLFLLKRQATPQQLQQVYDLDPTALQWKQGRILREACLNPKFDTNTLLWLVEKHPESLLLRPSSNSQSSSSNTPEAQLERMRNPQPAPPPPLLFTLMTAATQHLSAQTKIKMLEKCGPAIHSHKAWNHPDCHFYPLSMALLTLPLDKNNNSNNNNQQSHKESQILLEYMIQNFPKDITQLQLDPLGLLVDPSAADPSFERHLAEMTLHRTTRVGMMTPQRILYIVQAAASRMTCLQLKPQHEWNGEGFATWLQYFPGLTYLKTLALDLPPPSVWRSKNNKKNDNLLGNLTRALALAPNLKHLQLSGTSHENKSSATKDDPLLLAIIHGILQRNNTLHSLSLEKFELAHTATLLKLLTTPQPNLQSIKLEQFIVTDASAAVDAISALQKMVSGNLLPSLQHFSLRWAKVTRQCMDQLLVPVSKFSALQTLSIRDLTHIVGPTRKLDNQFSSVSQCLSTLLALPDCQLQSVTASDVVADIEAICGALKVNQTLTEYNVVTSLNEAWKQTHMARCLANHNHTLLDINMETKTSSCPTGRSYKRIRYWSRLNQLGRSKARHIQSQVSDIVDLLLQCQLEQKGHPEGVTIHSLQYGMLRESPQIWSAPTTTSTGS